MERSLESNTRNRIIKAALIGLILGTVILGGYLVPTVIDRETERTISAIREENLIPSGGEAFDSFSMAEVVVTALLNGKSQEGMSVSADSERWITPQNGMASLRVAPNSYNFIAGYENQRVFLSAEVFSNQTNKIVLDIGNAPSAPDLQIFDLSNEEVQLLPLGIVNADEATAKFLPQGVSITRQNGVFVLQVHKSSLSSGFSVLSLTTKNNSGEASSFVGLRNPRDKTVVEIYTVTDLANIHNNLSGSYLLKNNLDMSEIDNWTPIGTHANPFTGVFDGDNYEIAGFHSPKRIAEGESFALFGSTKNAELRNVIFRDPIITPQVPTREVGTTFTCSVLAANLVQSLVENCSSFGGMVSPTDNSAGGLLGGADRCILRGLYSSTDVVCTMKNQFLPNTGGIVAGVSASYISGCHNAGSVRGNHLTGGVVGYANASDVTHSLNSGYVWGSTIVGAIPAGGILQTNDDGYVGYSYFVRGLAGVGATCPGGIVTSIVPITERTFRNPDELQNLGSFNGDFPEWAYASLDAIGPMPYGIFKERTYPPIVVETNGKLIVSPVQDTQYFYTIDGSSPYAVGVQPVNQIDINLKHDQILNLFAAKKGCWDSEIITITGMGGT